MQLTTQQIQCNIVRLPNRPPVMLARDLADIYETEPKRISEAVRRNPERFPEDFAFRLSDEEWEILRSQNGTANYDLRSQNATSNFSMDRYAPMAFTRNGSNMLSTVLKGPAAAARSVQIMRAFSAMEEAGAANTEVLRDQLTVRDQQLAERDQIIAAKDQRIDGLQTKLIGHLESHIRVDASVAKLERQKAALERREAVRQKTETVIRMESQRIPREEIARTTGITRLYVRQIVLKARRDGRLPPDASEQMELALV